MFPDSTKLMNCGQSTDDCMRLHPHVTCQCPAVRKNDVIIHDAIMGNMTVGQKIPSIADASDRSDGRRPIHGDKFTETIVITNLEVSRLPGVFQILGLLSDRTARMKAVPGPNFDRTANRNLILQPAASSDGHFAPNHAIGANVDVRTNLRLWI